MSRAPRKWALLGALFVALVAADQWTKFLAVDRLTTVFAEGPQGLGARVVAFYKVRHLESEATAPYVVLRPVWRMRYVENPGAAWGLFRDMSPGLRNVFFVVVSLGAVAFILHYYRRLEEEQRFLQVALAFVLSGAVGNFVDRLARRYVIDFIDWHWWNRPDLFWPTFNVADALIVVGVAMLILHPGPREDEARAGKAKEAGAA